MPNKVWAQCPCCKKEANGKEEIDIKFGWRDTNKTVPQSYCYACRGAGCKAGEPCKAKK
jgi:hypothetical protein